MSGQLTFVEANAPNHTVTDVERGQGRIHGDAIQGHDHATLSNGQHESHSDARTQEDPHHQDSFYEELLKREQVFWDRLRGEGRNVPGWMESVQNIVLSSCT